jgi:hypothetical protein
LPVPAGITHEPRTIWSAYFGLTPRRTEMSTVSSHFVEILVRGMIAHASSTEYRFDLSQPVTAFLYFLPAMVFLRVALVRRAAERRSQGDHIGVR